ncbi:hypothetical protein CAPTEDRAFT_192046 [Capitella teleta]|uniref:Uncharacterized protein n=1 Tax=Capitella teleta TaxID=283909 RepID=R7VL74_CAPTE|nr:hypothetical protein CAPTEDRAFT_192046 [Capitella teleta]|eukprot:ELU17370.1 hypothetical protein CAPTEDRAFT_192046 [Capitella teleta]
MGAFTDFVTTRNTIIATVLVVTLAVFLQQRTAQRVQPSRETIFRENKRKQTVKEKTQVEGINVRRSNTEPVVLLSGHKKLVASGAVCLCVLAFVLSRQNKDVERPRHIAASVFIRVAAMCSVNTAWHLSTSPRYFFFSVRFAMESRHQPKNREWNLEIFNPHSSPQGEKSPEVFLCSYLAQQHLISYHRDLPFLAFLGVSLVLQGLADSAGLESIFQTLMDSRHGNNEKQGSI